MPLSLQASSCMKSSGSARRSGKPHACLIVDGYNVIARMHSSALRDIPNVDEFRDKLVGQLSEYSAFSGEVVIVVYDAHQTQWARQTHNQAGVTVIYTELQETADARIERLVYELRDTYRQITVATSDNAEQQVAFGGGALRISANGLLVRLEQMKYQIRGQLQPDPVDPKGQILDRIRHDVANILEKWRRE
jgi:uncharacterized protein